MSFSCRFLGKPANPCSRKVSHQSRTAFPHLHQICVIDPRTCSRILSPLVQGSRSSSASPFGVLGNAVAVATENQAGNFPNKGRLRGLRFGSPVRCRFCTVQVGFLPSKGYNTRYSGTPLTRTTRGSTVRIPRLFLRGTSPPEPWQSTWSWDARFARSRTDLGSSGCNRNGARGDAVPRGRNEVRFAHPCSKSQTPAVLPLGIGSVPSRNVVRLGSQCGDPERTQDCAALRGSFSPQRSLCPKRRRRAPQGECRHSTGWPCSGAMPDRLG